MLSYPALLTKNIESVRSQVVAGTNFMLMLNNLPFSKDQYIAIVSVSLGTTSASILNLYRNGIDVKQAKLPTPSY
jgi:hypothetical protein